MAYLSPMTLILVKLFTNFIRRNLTSHTKKGACDMLLTKTIFPFWIVSDVRLSMLSSSFRGDCYEYQTILAVATEAFYWSSILGEHFT